MADLPKITYKVVSSTLVTDAGFDITNCIFSNVDTKYSRTIQQGEVSAEYKVYNNYSDIGVLQPYKLNKDGARVKNITYIIPSEMIRAFNPEQFPLVEKRMISDTFNIDINNITIMVDGVEVSDSVFN